MTNDNTWAAYDRHQDPGERNAALAFFGLPKDPEPEVAQAADGIAARMPDPVQQAAADGRQYSPQEVDARAVFGLDGGLYPWQRN